VYNKVNISNMMKISRIAVN